MAKLNEMSFSEFKKKWKEVAEKQKLNEKQNLYNEVKEKYKTNDADYSKKLKKFEKVYELANVIAAKSRTKENTINELRDDLVREYYYHKDSLLSKFPYVNKNMSDKKARERARKLATQARFKNFINIHGDEKVLVKIEGLYDDKEKEISLKNLLKKYMDGVITKKYFYNRIEYFKDKELKDYNTKEYRQADINADFSRYAER